MKRVLLLLALGALGLVADGIGTPARAQNYPWCAQYSDGMGGAMNCGFVSFDQCMEDVRGMGGFCMLNNRYEPPPGPHPARSEARPKKHAPPKQT